MIFLSKWSNSKNFIVRKKNEENSRWIVQNFLNFILSIEMLSFTIDRTIWKTSEMVELCCAQLPTKRTHYCTTVAKNSTMRSNICASFNRMISIQFALAKSIHYSITGRLTTSWFIPYALHIALYDKKRWNLKINSQSIIANIGLYTEFL